MQRIVTLSFILLVLFNAAFAGAGLDTLTINTWLVAGPFDLVKPVFINEKDAQMNSWSATEYLNYENINLESLLPAEGQPLDWIDHSVNWQKTDSDQILFTNADTNTFNINYTAFYIFTDQWQEIELLLKTKAMKKVYVDGKELSKKETIEDFSQKIKLEPGNHLILIKNVGNALEDQFSGKIVCYSENIKVSADPIGFMTIDNVLYTEKVTQPKISFDGEYVALSLSKVNKETKKTRRWIELRKAADGELVHSFMGDAGISAFIWSPVSNDFIYQTTKDEKTTLWCANLESGKNEKLLSDMESMGDVTWSPTGEFILYTLSQDGIDDKSGVRRLRDMPDRQPGSRQIDYLYRLNLKGKTSERLSFGSISTMVFDISKDGEKAIIARYHPYVIERPYDKTDFYILNLKTMALDSIFSLKWANNLQWSPDGKKILVTGGVSMFDGIGKTLPQDVTPNDYDGQAFIYDVNSKKVQPVTRNFDPAIVKAKWSFSNNMIYFVAENRSWRSLYQYNPAKDTFLKLDIGMEAVLGFDVSVKNMRGVYYGSSAAETFKVCTIILNKKKPVSQVIYEPAKTVYDHTKLGQVKRWTFENKDGVEIEGRYYLPPDFDESKKYPCIVYYYGGTSPVSRDFDGRYPKNYWAANGYVVYVMQPSGATGFGQEFAAKHVNEWGSIVPEEIILGTEKFVADHSFIDKDKLGCIGASYGGFTTETLVSKTDMFAAAVSHAGISAVPSYWGEGYWGYAYGAVANANTFPWSDPDVFLKNSALYNADKINTPLLLTHGTKDTNVPPGESIQLYTALKLLGKEVELLQCKDQNHFVLEYGQREKWSKSIVAWFDKYLKKDSGWWDDLYDIQQ